MPIPSYYKFVFQVAIIYLNSATAKLSVEEWKDGTAIYYWFRLPVFGNPECLDIIIKPLILNGNTLFIITWSVILLEFFLFAGLFMKKRYKRYYLIIGIFIIIHGLASFFFTMAACLIVYLKSIQSHFEFQKLYAIKKIFMIYSLIAGVLVGVLMLIASLILKYGSLKPYYFFGYRTPRSLKNEADLFFAYKKAASYLVYLSLISILLGVLSILLDFDVKFVVIPIIIFLISIVVVVEVELYNFDKRNSEHKND